MNLLKLDLSILIVVVMASAFMPFLIMAQSVQSVTKTSTTQYVVLEKDGKNYLKQSAFQVSEVDGFLNGINKSNPIRSGRFFELIDQSGVRVALQYYNKEVESGRIEKFSESLLDNLGYLLMREDKLYEAVLVFETNVKCYPNSSLTYHSLANAHMKRGHLEKAREYYHHSLKLNPNNHAAALLIQRIKYIIKYSTEDFFERYKKC